MAAIFRWFRHGPQGTTFRIEIPGSGETTMSWDPDVYMKFANERTRPAMELLARVPLRHQRA